MKGGGHGHSQSGSRGNKKIGGGMAKSFGDASTKTEKTSGGRSAKSDTQFKTRG